ncbi:maleylpyruvate isomerase N-terminal domain-containing protein [Actinophytocola oryzae]|uniref:Uncharacterized protein (TIGR03083 family) n=1 Tax=Actinophytocola oryzae TaxID=502181 RepID=A0A4R7VCV7_9PSEU|nr:maleylpyruvate isomerase N-terminal domain-containing protein [Actinophytocola oryzae]TDV46942.1 uncharacterized protein (TIGR03083 family) [Actinophytocola oryzae]
MEFSAYLEQIREQADAFRAAAVTAGPDTAVPTTPGWDVRRLVAHLARVYSWVIGALDTDPGAERPTRERPPEEWDAVVPFFDDRLDTMLTGLRERGPDAAVWAFGNDKTVRFWARRQAHETAIHRLDAEHAAYGDTVDHLTYAPDFAADGADEALTLMIRDRIEVGGTVLFHAADAGRAWLATLTPGAAPEIGPATVVDADASVVGTADAVYRAVWGRPSSAVVGGDPTLVAALRTP